MTRRDRQIRRERRRRRFDPMQRANDFTMEPSPRTEQLSIERRMNLLSNLAKNAMLQAGKPPGRQLLETVLELPEPSQLDVGRQIILRSGAGVADRIYTGMQLGDDSFAWVEVTTELVGATFTNTGSFAVTSANGVAIGHDGNVWVTRFASHAVGRYTTGGALINTFSDGACLTPSLCSMRFCNPFGIAFLPGYNRYVVGHYGSNFIGRYTTANDLVCTPTPYTLAGGGSYTVSGLPIVNPLYICADSSGYHYVADPGNNRITKHGPGSSSTHIATLNNGLSGPVAAAVDGTGDVYIVDNGNSRVRVLSQANAFLRQFGSAGSGPGQFSNPSGIAIHPLGQIHVVDNGNNRVNVFTPAGTFVTSYGSLGSGAGQFNGPRGIAINPAGVIFVADFNNNRVSVWV